MKISKSKQELASIISENGGWRDGAEWAAMDKTDGNCNDNAIGFFSGEFRPECFGKIKMWRCRHIETVFMGYEKSIFCEKIIGNWHQTILSRAEYFHLYPAQDDDGWIEWNGGERPVDGGEFVVCKVRSGREWRDGKPIMAKVLRWSHTGGIADIIAYRLHKPEHVETEYKDGVKPTDTAKVERPSKPTIEQLAADYRNAKDLAERKQQEADAAHKKADVILRMLERRAESIGFTTKKISAKQEPELVITDLADLRIGDEVEATYRGLGRIVGRVIKIDIADKNQPVFVSDGNRFIWATDWRFIRRP